MNHLPPIQLEEIPVWSLVVEMCLTALSLAVPSISESSVQPFQRGFFCDDHSLRYPYKSSTVTVGALFAGAVLIPVLAMWASEAWALRARASRCRRALLGHFALPAWPLRLLRATLRFGLGLGFVEVLVDVAKYTTGRLRPHFFDACRPSVACDAVADPHEYVLDYHCTGDNAFAVHQSRLSFPSGHSALSFYAAIFTVLYLERRVQWPRGASVLKTALQLLVVGLAWFTALSRLADHKHHWGDVLVGSALGAAFAYLWVPEVLVIHAEREDYRDVYDTELVEPEK